MITSTFDVLFYSNDQIFAQNSIILTFQGNRILKANTDIKKLHGFVLVNSEEGMGSYYIVLGNNTIHNIDHLDIKVTQSLIDNQELVSQFDSLKLAIEAALL